MTAGYNIALAEEEARVAGIYPVGMMGDPESPPEWFEEFFECHADGDEPIFTQLPELKPLATDDAEVIEWAHALFYASRWGYLVKAEVCVRKYSRQGFWQSGWGYVQFHWLYVATADEIGPAVLKAARTQHATEQTKAGAA